MPSKAAGKSPTGSTSGSSSERPCGVNQLRDIEPKPSSQSPMADQKSFNTRTTSSIDKYSVSQDDSSRLRPDTSVERMVPNLSINLRQRRQIRQRKELKKLLKKEKNLQNTILNEGILNARNTVALVAILIATVTFTAGISPPGGIYQEGQNIGKAIASGSIAFKVFSICNNIALFASLLIVLIMSSIFPASKQGLEILLIINTATMWVAVIFMAAAYVAATWVVLPYDQRTWIRTWIIKIKLRWIPRWMLDPALFISCYTIYLALVLVLTARLRRVVIKKFREVWGRIKPETGLESIV